MSPLRLPHVYPITHGRHFAAATPHAAHTRYKPPPHVGAPLVTPGRPQGGNTTAACMRPPPGRHECRPYVYPTFIPSRTAGIPPPPPGQHECRPYVYPTFIPSHTAGISPPPRTNRRTQTAAPTPRPNRRPHVGAPLVTPGRPQGGNAAARMHASATRAT